MGKIARARAVCSRKRSRERKCGVHYVITVGRVQHKRSQHLRTDCPPGRLFSPETLYAMNSFTKTCILWMLVLCLHRCGAFTAKKTHGTCWKHDNIASTVTYVKKTIFGENIVPCRPFELRSPKTFEFVGSYKSFNEIPQFAVPEIVFIGRSNVGKSSLLNCLTGMHKSIAVVGKTPGTTQSVNIFKCSDNSGPICTFADLPGFGFAKLSKVQQDNISQLLKDYFSARGALKLVMLLVDPRRDPSPADLDTFAVSTV